MRKARIAAVLLLVLFGGVAVLVTRTNPARPASFAGCGVERWAVKTLQDRPLLRPARTSSLSFLVTRPAPAVLPDRRLPAERGVYTVIASVVLVRPEADSDLHLVLSDGVREMIAESPSPACTARALTPLRHAMAVARSQVRLCRRAKVTGVEFFDFNHGQTGVAANAIELHPVLAFTCLA